MKKKKYYLYLEDSETSIVFNSLIRLKNSLLQQNRNADCVDDVILKVMNAPVKKIKVSHS